MGGYTQEEGREGQIDHCLKVNHGWGIAGSGESLLLKGVISVPIRLCFAFRIFRLS